MMKKRTDSCSSNEMFDIPLIAKATSSVALLITESLEECSSHNCESWLL